MLSRNRIERFGTMSNLAGKEKIDSLLKWLKTQCNVYQVRIGRFTLREEILARSNFGEFGELPKKFAKFAKISSRKI